MSTRFMNAACCGTSEWSSRHLITCLGDSDSHSDSGKFCFDRDGQLRFMPRRLGPPHLCE
ncbi:hypothetical protein FOA52_008399 [Chlamydomonas sp. UWO 241]|nr:hypothetical protein FOA52_008399 [Chlamydomonas sp. UWO 241]